MEAQGHEASGGVSSSFGEDMHAAHWHDRAVSADQHAGPTGQHAAPDQPVAASHGAAADMAHGQPADPYDFMDEDDEEEGPGEQHQAGQAGDAQEAAAQLPPAAVHGQVDHVTSRAMGALVEARRLEDVSRSMQEEEEEAGGGGGQGFGATALR
jgi:hypothetical protein